MLGGTIAGRRTIGAGGIRRHAAEMVASDIRSAPATWSARIPGRHPSQLPRVAGPAHYLCAPEDTGVALASSGGRFTSRRRALNRDSEIARRIGFMESRRPDIRLAEPQDVASLPEIERVAGLLFKTHPADLGIPDEVYDRPNSIETFEATRKAGRLWVACGPAREPIGFALVLDIAGFAHLDELDVLPSYRSSRCRSGASGNGVQLGQQRRLSSRDPQDIP